MADLSELDRSNPFKLAGANPTSGITTFWAMVSSTGSLQISGEGVAGTPAGGVLSVQGVSGGSALNVTATNFPSTIDTNYGIVGANTLRSAAQIGNATGAAAFGTGTTSTQVLRVVLPTDQTAIPVTQSTSPWITKDQSDGPVTPGTVASFSQLAGGQYNSILPNLLTGQQSAIQLDSNGRVLTNSSASVADESAFTYGVTTEVAVGGVYQDTSPTLTAGQQGAVRLTQYRGFHTNLRTASGIEITSDSPGNAANQRLHVATPDTTVASTVLGTLNATVSVALSGMASVGFQLAAGTLVGTITPQCSVDGGTTWTNCSFFNVGNSTVSTSITFSSSNTVQVLSVLPIGGASHARVIVTAYISGTANALMRASQVTGTVGSSLILADPQTFQYANIDARNSLRVAQATLLIGNEQTGSLLDTNMWATTLVGSGTSSVGSGQNTLSTGTTANSSAFLGSLLRGRFLTGTVNAFVGGMRLGDTGVANNIRRWGAYDSSDGVYFVLNGTTIGIGIRSGGSDTVVTTFNGTHTFILDTNFHNYEIQWTAGTVYFYQDGNLIHTYNATSTPLATTSSFKLGFETTNSGGSTTNAQMFIRGSSIMRYGQATARPRYFHPFYTNRVQVASVANPGNTTTATATINPTTSGNIIIVTAFCQAGTLTCTDSASQTYSTAVSQVGTGGNPPNIYTFYKANTAAGVTSVTVTDSGTNTGVSLIVTEYSGVITASPVDKTASSGTSATGTPWSSTATTATVQAQELLIGNMVDTHANTTTITPGTSWNSVASVAGEGGGASGVLFQEEQYTNATGAYTATGTNSAANAYLATISTFKLTTSALSSGFTIPNTSTTIKIGPGTLQKIMVNTLGTGNASVTFYDNTTSSGSVLAVLSLTEAIGQFPFDLDFSTGLTMVVNSISADFTVIYD